MELCAVFTHPARNSHNSSRGVYSYERCSVQFYYFVQMTEHTLAYLVRTVYIEIYTKIHITFSFLLKNKKKKKNRTGKAAAENPGVAGVG